MAQPGKLTLANLQAHTRATTDHADEDTQTAGISSLQDVFARVQRFANSHLETHREVRYVVHFEHINSSSDSVVGDRMPLQLLGEFYLHIMVVFPPCLHA